MALKRWLKTAKLRDESEPACKRQKLESFEGYTADPEIIITWNCNSLVKRAENNAASIAQFVRNTSPDIICLQEVRMCSKGSNRKQYSQDGKYRADADSVDKLLKTAFKDYSARFSLAEQKKSGTAMLVHKRFKPRSIHYSIESGVTVEAEGRVILAEFETFRLLNTYSVNNGWTTASFARRKQWDDMIADFVVKAKDHEKPLVYVGDLNCSPSDHDLSHPQYFKKAILLGAPRPPDDDRGQPGCAPNEQRRFKKWVQDGALVDAYRMQHPRTPPTIDGPYFTWRGGEGKYFGKGMRIDHALVSQKLASRVVRVEILGHGSQREGFMGSDHCPLLIEIGPATRPVTMNSSIGTTGAQAQTASNVENRIDGSDREHIEADCDPP